MADPPETATVNVPEAVMVAGFISVANCALIVAFRGTPA